MINSILRVIFYCIGLKMKTEVDETQLMVIVSVRSVCVCWGGVSEGKWALIDVKNEGIKG